MGSSSQLFAMVEELASLVKDNLQSKHLLLSMEQAFINFLQHDDDLSSSDGVIELEPMDPYNRLLLHRLADIFGFAHVSVGEGDDRHLILERCIDTAIPSILLSDILFQYDEPQQLTTPHELLRNNSSPVIRARLPSPHTLEERERAYLAARERIFSTDIEEMRESIKQKPRGVPVVARRMIAHALGQNLNSSNQDAAVGNCNRDVKIDELNVQDKDKAGLRSREIACQGATSIHGKHNSSSGKVERNNPKCGPQSPAHMSSNANSILQDATSKSGFRKGYSKEEQLGAAKRMFANALGLRPGRVSARSSETKQLDMV